VNGPIRYLATALFVAFAVLVGAVSYRQVVAADDYRDDPRNLRVAAGRSGRERGLIITADGEIVAASEANPDDPLGFRRTYPYRDLYSHIVGYATLLFGSTGLEETHSADLVSDRDATISGVITAILGGDLRPSGLLLTMVSTPGFDPNELLGPGTAPIGQALEDDPAEPLLNRATAATYPPGSTFKVITTAAALQSGVASSGTEYPDLVELELPGSTATISNFDGGVCTNGTEVSLADAFTRSCNTIFGMVGMQAGAEALVDAADGFGFNLAVPFDLRTVPSVIPPAASFENDLPGVAQSAIGQRDVQATPLQMAMVAAAVANGGEMMEPYLVQEVFNADGIVEKTTEPVAWRRAVSPATAATLTDLMERVVTAGTGRRAAVPGVRLAGKTGTAEVPGAAPHAWFIGFGPVDAGDAPQIALAVLVESGGDAGESASGGTVAAPIAKAVFSEFFGLGD